MRYWTVCVEEGTKRLVPGYMHSLDCNLKFKTREECLHECEMQQLIRDYQGYMKSIDDPAGLEQLFKCLKSVATGYSIGATMRSVLLKLELVRESNLTEKGFNLLLYLHNQKTCFTFVV